MRFLAILAALVVSGCGGGSGSPDIVPPAQAAAVDGCPVGDATSQLQAMVDSAKGSLTLPACVFQTSAPIVISKPLRLVGSDATVNGTIIRSTADEAVVIDPAVKISVAAGFNKRGWWGSVENLRIEHAVSGGGKHALVIRVRPGFFVSTWLVDRVHLGDFGEAGLYLDNSAANVDGIFTGAVRRSFIENGIKGDLIGDSVTVEGNVITNGPSRFTKPGLPGVDVSLIPGAAEVVVQNNNITMGGGCVLIRSGIGVNVFHNWCESATAPDGVGMIQLNDCIECTLRDNRVQTAGGSAQWAIALNNSPMTLIDSNKLTAGKQGHISITGTSSAKLAGLNRFDGAASGRVVAAPSGLLQ